MGALFVYLATGGAELDRESKEAAGIAIMTLGKGWDSTEIYRNLVPELHTDENFKKEIPQVLSALQLRLGPIQRYDSLTGESKIVVNEKGKSIFAEYSAKIICQKDYGTINLILDNRSGKWLVRRFHVNSKAFLLN